MSKPKQLYWIGERGSDGKALEWFGGVAGVRDPIPARDLSPDETAELTEAQWECINSTTGKRLYSASPKAASTSTAVPSATG